MKISVESNSRKVAEALDILITKMDDSEGVLRLIGETLSESTKQRFVEAKSPDGTTWKANKQTTLDFYAKEFGTARTLKKKPLTGKSRELQTTITYEVTGDQLFVGSPLPYAAMQHFGGVTSPRSMIPNKAIPARPFLGISEEDEQEIIEIINDLLLS